METLKKTKITINIDIIPLLCFIFIILKLCNVISWSWLWVFCPFWIPLSIFLVLILGIYIAKMFIKYENTSDSRYSREEILEESDKQELQ